MRVVPFPATSAVIVLVWTVLRTALAAEPIPLERAHAHNDYEHARPLLDALDQGFCSAEADIYLVDGQLLVAHDRPKVKPERTLEALYLEPLRTRVRANGGRVHRGGPPFSLLVDFKGDADATYVRLREVLERYRDILTVFTPQTTRTNAVTVVLSGNRPWKTMEAEKERLAGLDGRLPDLEAGLNPHLVPWVSDNWRNHFRWNGEGEFPADESAKLKALVLKAHAQGCRIRFWAAADREEVWNVHHDAGVDLINTDHLAELAAFLKARSSTRP
ncbi:MAG: phosphatidylinositol-specific phospholipase C/glycerophosphodiester phosphodiesterase family protein [Verrucomicrobiales bacterium]|nr:phosphatidylinositol-specific phospholipase C/glycerophosphodiester phosphodiesterase family protein [Verrucomicrobiales bacterium]